MNLFKNIFWINLNIWLIILLINHPLKAQKKPTILQTIASSNNFTSDLTYDGEFLWTPTFDQLLGYSVHDGSLIKEIDLINFDNSISGIAFDGKKFLLNIGQAFSPISKLNSKTGQISNEFNFNRGTYLHGMHWQESSLLLNVFYLNEQDTLFRLDTLGNIIDAYPMPLGMTIHAIVHDGSNYWVTENSNIDNPLLYKLDGETLEPIDTFIAPGGSYPLGLAWDGSHLWLSNNDSDEIYQLDVENLQEDFKIKVFPNPFVQEVHFELARSKTGYYVELLDMKGAIVESKNTIDSALTLTFDKSRLASGLYFYLVYDLKKKGLLGKGKLIA